MATSDDEIYKTFQRLKNEARQREARRLTEEVLRQTRRNKTKQKQRSPTKIIVHECYCPDCKHRMWIQDVLIPTPVQCSVCGYVGKFKKRLD